MRQIAFILLLATFMSLLAMGLAAPLAAYQQPVDDQVPDMAPDNVESLFSHDEFADRAVLDSLRMLGLADDSINDADRPADHQIFLVARTYPDHINLRWAPSDYVTWKALNDSGYVVLRIDNKDFTLDTLAIVKPNTLEQFKAQFGPDDNLAASAAEVIWGDHSTQNTIDAQQDMNPYTAANAADDLDQIFSTAMVVAEMRFDIAQAMGLGLCDNQVQKGRSYTYIVKQNMPNESLVIWNNPITVKMDKPFKPSQLTVVITDSISAPGNVTLYWPFTAYTLYDIERRQTAALTSTAGVDGMVPGAPVDSLAQWVKVNTNPFLMLQNTSVPDGSMIQYVDTPPMPGVYEYRLVGYDSYGDASLPSEPHAVTLPDMMPPRAPIVTRIVVDHPDPDNATAHVYFQKDTLEADLKGYLPMYRPRAKASENAVLREGKQNNDTQTQKVLEQTELVGDWRQLTDHWLAPSDTLFHCDVSGLPSGDISIMAADYAGNVTSGAPQFIFLEDYKAPAAPDSLRARVAPDGTVVLRWKEPADLDVRYYEVYFANDPSHEFIKLTAPDQIYPMYIDSIAPGLNQAYIYYEVRAVDYSGNTSLPSERLRVVRPNYMPPHPCRIDSLYNDEAHVFMRWIQPGEQDLAYTRLLRRKRPAKDWQIIGIFPADSVRTQGNILRITDHPDPDMANRYEYAMEAYNLNGVCSGLSLVSSVLHTGPKGLNLPIALMATYKPDNHESILAWELKAPADALPNDDWWYCIYRKGSDDKDFQFLMSAPKHESSFSDYLLRPGQAAEYFIKIRFNDGRYSQNSNTVKVTAPK